MNRSKKVLMAGAILAAAASTFSVSAADQSDWFACERAASASTFIDCAAYLRPNRDVPVEAHRSPENTAAAVPATSTEPAPATPVSFPQSDESEPQLTADHAAPAESGGG